jgi:hypothetical protein
MWWYQNLWCVIKLASASEITLHLVSTWISLDQVTLHGGGISVSGML